MADDRYLSIIVLPDEAGDESRTFRVSHGRLRLILWAVGVSGVLLVLLAGSWWYLAARALRASALEEEVEALQRDRSRLVTLTSRLEDLEERYARLRSLFGPGPPSRDSDLWVAPPAARSATVDEEDTEARRLPTSWPLTVPGFVTQPLVEGAGRDHPGLDIAVPADSYIRASGRGEVVEAGEDPVYGRYVVLDHGGGYRTRYAHASQLLVEVGRGVRRNEVIALSGSTGRSTAPHLHFEITLDGAPVDPLTLVRQP